MAITTTGSGQFHRPLLYLALSLAAALLMISNGSIWIDEGQTLHFAWQPDFATWWDTLRTNSKSEAQMPASMLFAWLGVQAIGDGEWQLRATNLLWVGLAGLAVGLAGRRLQNRFALAILLLHPFLWYYANEARPYALQIASGAWLIFLLVRWQESPEIRPGDAWIFLAVAVTGYGSSLLFAFPLLGFFAAVALQWRWRRTLPSLSKAAVVPLVLAVMLLGGLTFYFLETLQRGAAGARLWKVGPTNLFFALYELLGFSGLGPPRNELRELARTPSVLLQTLLQPRFLGGLGGLSMVYAAVLWHLWKQRRNTVVRLASVFILVTAGALLAGATVMKFPFWGRHLAPLLPAVVLLIALAVAPTAIAGIWRRNIWPSLLLIGLTISSLVVRFDAQYAKDDYRTAARLARRALDAGKTIWWSADNEECAQYYQLHAAKRRAGDRLAFVVRPTAAEIAALPRPDIVFQSKSDVFDIHGTIAGYISANGLRESTRLPAFVIWIRPGIGLETLFESNSR